MNPDARNVFAGLAVGFLIGVLFAAAVSVVASELARMLR